MVYECVAKILLLLYYFGKISIHKYPHEFRAWATTILIGSWIAMGQKVIYSEEACV